MRCILEEPEVHKFKLILNHTLTVSFRRSKIEVFLKHDTKSTKIFLYQSGWWDVKEIYFT